MTPVPLTRMSTRQYRRLMCPRAPSLAAMPWWFRGLLITAGYVVLAWLEVILVP